MRKPTSHHSRRPTAAPLALALAFGIAAAPTVLRAQLATSFRRGDVNGNGVVDIADPIALLGCLFLGGACSSCPDAADSNDDGKIDLSDASNTLTWLFVGGKKPPLPGPYDCGVDPTVDDLGGCTYELPGCGGRTNEEDEGFEGDPRTADVLSRIHYASRAAPDPDREELDESERSVKLIPVPRKEPYDPRPGIPPYAWNSPVGRSYTGTVAHFAVDPDASIHMERGSPEAEILRSICSVCVEPEYYVKASDRTFTDWPDVRFQAPANAFGSQAEALVFLGKVHAEQPFFLPFSDASVRLGHGWFYSGDDKKLHRACDYSRSGVEEGEDPTFLVKSSSWGRVVAVIWDGNGGNIVGVEHTAPGGQKIMILYLHLRNGKSHDVAKAKSSTSSDAKYVKYRAFATNYPDHLSWGTEDQKIQVEVGDDVAPGTVIGYAGNTGAGGAGSGLNDDGSPENWRGNVHLHVYFAVPNPTTEDTWVWVDPYGVYSQVDTGCYDLLKDTQFSRLYAPFYPTFHGVPYEIFAYYFGYYPDMGYDLQTLSVHRKDNQLLVSGSFQRDLPGRWYAQGYMTLEEFDAKADSYWLQGYIPRETCVTKSLSGSPRYTAIWRHALAGEQIEHRAALTNTAWQDLWDDRVLDDEWRLEDYFAYTSGNSTRHCALVTSHEGRPFTFSGLLSSSELDAKIDVYKANGLLPVSVHVAELSSGRKYTGIFRPVEGCWKVFWGRNPAEYQQLVDDHVALGYQVWKLQGYANSTRFAVVFHKDEGPCH